MLGDESGVAIVIRGQSQVQGQGQVQGKDQTSYQALFNDRQGENGG